MERRIENRHFEAHIEASGDESMQSSQCRGVRAANASNRVVNGGTFTGQEKHHAVDTCCSELLDTRVRYETDAICPGKHVVPAGITCLVHNIAKRPENGGFSAQLEDAASTTKFTFDHGRRRSRSSAITDGTSEIAAGCEQQARIGRTGARTHVDVMFVGATDERKLSRVRHDVAVGCAQCA